MSARTSRAAAQIVQLPLIAAAANMIYLAFAGGYDWRIGSLHLVAHDIFKPLMFLSGSFLLAVLVRLLGNEHRSPSPAKVSLPLCILLISAIVTATYAVSFWINYHHTEWAHTDISAARASFYSIPDYFLKRQYDGFYRPIGLLSLRADWRFFGEALRWYHLQSVLLHLLNSLLVAWLCREVGYGGAAPLAAALIFAVSPPAFEAVAWPGARFDELSVMFSVLAIVAAIRYAEAGKSRATLIGACCCLALGLASKETAYAVPVLLVVVRMRRGPQGPKPEQRRRWALAIVSTFAVAAVAIIARILVVGGIGGYGAPLHFAVTAKTLTSLLMRAPLAGQFAVDGSVPLPWWVKSALALFPMLLVYIASTVRPEDGKREWWLPVAALVALAPVANVIVLVTPSLVQGRYLYSGSVWMALLLGVATVRTLHPRAALTMWVMLAGLATFFNQYVHKQRLETIPTSVTQIVRELRSNPQCTEVALVHMPDQMNGSLFFSDELLRSVRAALPGVAVELRGASSREASALSACLVYAWTDAEPPPGRMKKIRDPRAKPLAPSRP